MIDFKCFLLVSLIFSVSGCGGGGGASNSNSTSSVEVVPDSTPSLALALREAVDNGIIPSLEKFLESAESMKAGANDFCEAPDEALLTSLQERWRSLFGQWYEVSLYNFGPLDDDIVFPTFTFIDSLRLRGTDYTETVRDEIATDIASDRVLNNEYFSGKTFQRVGLLALESTIFETSYSGHSQLNGDVLADYEFQPRKCDVLRELSHQLVVRATYVRDGWVTSFKKDQSPYRDLFLDAELEDGTAPIAQLILSAQDFLEYLQARNVVNTAAQISGYSWQAISSSIDQVEVLLNGTTATTDSFFDVMISNGNQNSVDSVRESIKEIRDSIETKDSAMLEISLGKLDGNFKREISDSLGVELGVNFSDGD